MIMTVRTNGVVLRRVHSKIGEIITWEVLSADKKVRIGIIRKLNDHWRTKSVGWQQFPVRYWLGSKFYPSAVVVGNSRAEVITKMLEVKFQ